MRSHNPYQRSSPERARTEVRFLSGGERNRALLAKLMTKPANVIVLDEPTNDLDSETLELLEEQLADFRGTLLMVSHDRTFLNNVVSSTIVFEGDRVNEYVGGYDDWRAAVARREENDAKPAERTKAKSEKVKAAPTESRKLSYKDKRELEQLPGRIESLEAKIASMHERMGDPKYYQQDRQKIASDAVQLKEFEQQLEQAYALWEKLES